MGVFIFALEYSKPIKMEKQHETINHRPPLSHDMELKPVSVVVLPLPTQGHLNQLLLLARRLAALSIPVHFVSSAAHNRQARDRSSSSSDPSPHLHFHDLPLPDRYPSTTPPPRIPNPAPRSHFPSHLQPLFDAAVLHFPSPLSSLLLSLSSSSRRLVLVHDSAMSFSAPLASSLPNAEIFVFHTASAYANLFFRLNCPLSSPSRRAQGQQTALNFDDCFSEEFLQFIKTQHKMAAHAQGRILNTCRAIDGEFIDRLALQPDWTGQKIFAVGPLNPINVGRRRDHECLDWLDRQPEKSVLYISFGTITSLSRLQTAELAKALESSEQRFVWVVRDADRGDTYAQDGAEGEEEEVAGATIDSTAKNGVVVRGWAPQVEILAHRATGGFLSHCGWNSCMESLTFGVPMLTWPMHSDQPRNAVLVTEVLGAGVVGREWGRRREVVGAAEIRERIGRLVEGEEGRAAARRAEEVGVVMRECGRREEELEDFVDHICRI